MEPDRKPLIRYKPEALPELTAEAGRDLVRDQESEQVFAHGGTYATIRTAQPVTIRELMHAEPSAIIHHYTAPGLRERLMRAVRFEAFSRSAKGWIPSIAPLELIQTLICNGGRGAPVLTGLANTPTLFPNGDVIEAAGYNAGSGLYCTFEDGEFAKVKEYRSSRAKAEAQGEAAAAYQWILKELFGEFPFCSEKDGAVAVAALLTGLLRPMCGIAPGFAIISPVQSTGKTALALAIGVVANASDPGVTDWAEDEKEVDKTLFAGLLGGQRVFIFDNLREGLEITSAKMAKALTSETMEGRVLGLSQMLRVSTGALFMFTGNNIVIAGDISSRVITCRLDAHMERPDQREFSKDLLPWTLEHRPKIVAAALTIAKAFLDCKPGVDAKPTRFHTWDRMVRLPLIWAGAPDIAQKLDENHRVDPSLGLLRDVISAWRPALGSEPLTAGAILAKLENGFSPEAQALRDALSDLIADRRTPLNSQMLGVRFRKFDGRPIDGQAITSVFDGHKKANVWSVEPVGERL